MIKNIFILNYLENNIKILQKKNSQVRIIHITTPARCLKLPVWVSTNINIFEDGKCFELRYLYASDYIHISIRLISEVIYTMLRLWYTKITFKGKGFKIKKRRRTKTIKFFFYHSHLNAVIFKKSKLKQKKKNKIIVKFWNYMNYKKTEATVTAVRGLNIFTKRGLRISRQLVFKKTGKKSNY